MTTYYGIRLADKLLVHVYYEDGHEVPLPHFVKHSPAGFEWGYGGSGPADLALAILAHHLGDHIVLMHHGAVDPPQGLRSVQLYRNFKWDWVAHFPYEAWTLTSNQINEWLKRPERITEWKS